MINYSANKFKLLIFAFLFIITACGKDDNTDNPIDSNPIWEDKTITEGPDEAINESIIRVNNLLFSIEEDQSCTLIDSYDEYTENGNHRYRSTLPYPILDIPSEVSLNGKTYNVEQINLNGGVNSDKITFITIPSSVLKIGGLGITPETIIVGANVRSTVGLNATKIFWLPNTPPIGYRNATSKIAYASTSAYLKGGYLTEPERILIYSHLSSMFEVNGLLYIMSSPADRTCDLVGAKEVPKSLDITDVTKDGINFKVININPYAFYRAEDLTNLSFGEISAIRDLAFYGCGITSIKIPSSVTSIGAGAFSGCKNLQSLSFLDGEKDLYIGIYSYWWDNNKYTLSHSLRKIYIGRDLNYDTYYSEAPSPFYRLDNLEEVEIQNGETEISDNMFYGCIALRSVIIGNDITTIGKKAFSGCSAMESFKFGSALREIGADAFSDCTALTSFTSGAITPPACGSQALDDIDKFKCVLHVPSESIELYKEANQWKHFLKIE